MKKRGRLGLYITIGVLVGAVILYFWLTQETTRQYNWFESYSAESDQPYGTSYLKNLLASYRPDQKFKYNSKEPLTEFLPRNPASITDYVFVGSEFYLSAKDETVLLEFVKNGNNALIASSTLPETFVSFFKPDTCNEVMKSSTYQALTARMNFYHESLKLPSDVAFTRRFGPSDVATAWSVLHLPDSCNQMPTMTPLGYQSSAGVNFFKVPYGKGFFYFHTEPLVFTNFFLAKKDYLRYTENVLSHLTGKDIVWDEFSKLPEQEEKGKNSPLYFILQQPALKYAWWLLLATVVLYVCFAGKREQRVIPVLEGKVNTSLEFVNLISTLHYQNGNPIDMARKKMRYFLYFVRSKYGIQAPSFDADQIALLAMKSTVPVGEVNIIFERYRVLDIHTDFKSQSDKLIELFDAIENFNAKCR